MYKLVTYIPIVIRHKMNQRVLMVSLPKTGTGIFLFNHQNLWLSRANQSIHKARMLIVKGHEESFSY